MAGVTRKTTDESKPTPFHFINCITTSKKNVIKENPDVAKYYNGFIVNRTLSYFPDTIHYANAMNLFHHLDESMQFDFLINIVRKKNRFSKWSKPSHVEDLQAVKQYFGYSNEKAKQALGLLTSEQLINIKQKVFKGGRQ